MRLLLITLAVYASTCFCNAQSIEVGYVKEYNGKNAKTPLEGVAIQVEGASSTFSKSGGKFNLKFDVLKPGSVVKYKKIEKKGFVIFNEDAVNEWRISNNKTPFVIVMCKKSEFEELIKKYYRLMEKSYKKEYEKLKTEYEKLKAEAIAAKREAHEAIAAKREAHELQNKLDELECKYQEKMNDLPAKAERFARIDQNEMNEIEAEALQLLEEGRIEEAIKKREKLRINEKAREQLPIEFEEMKAHKESLEEGRKELTSKAEGLKKDIDFYELGVWNSEKNDSIKERVSTLVKIYESLSNLFGDEYNDELGKWMVKQLEYVNDRDSYLELAKKAADLPSVDGLYALGNVYEYLSINNDDMIMKARDCYTKSIELADPEDTLNMAKVRMEMLPDFSVRAANADIYYRIVSEEEHTVYICKKSLLQNNAPEGDFIIPAYVNFRDQKYRVIGIDDGAFMNDKELQSIVLPSTIQHIGKEAFRGCTALKRCKFEGDVMKIEENNRQNTIPEEVVLSVPNNSYHMMDWLSNRLTKMGETRNKKSVKAYESLLLQFVENKNTSNEDKISYYEQLMDIYADSLHSVYNLRKARKCLEKIIELDRDRLAEYHFNIGVLFQKEKRYADAWKYYRKAFDEGFYYALNNMAYMYALGLGVPVDLKKAHETIDQAIKLIPDDHNLYDSKGEFYLIQRDTANAKRYCQYAQNLIKKYDDSNNSIYLEYASNSTLFKSLYGKDNKYVDTLRNVIIQTAITATVLFNKLAQYNALACPDFDEILSMCIVTMPDSFSDFNDMYEYIKRMSVVLLVLKEKYPLFMLFYYGFADIQKENTLLFISKTIYHMYSLIEDEGINWSMTIDELQNRFNDIFKDEILKREELQEYYDNYKNFFLIFGKHIEQEIADSPDPYKSLLKKVFEDHKSFKTSAKELGLSQEILSEYMEQAINNIKKRIHRKN